MYKVGPNLQLTFAYHTTENHNLLLKRTLEGFQVCFLARLSKLTWCCLCCPVLLQQQRNIPALHTTCGISAHCHWDRQTTWQPLEWWCNGDVIVHYLTVSGSCWPPCLPLVTPAAAERSIAAARWLLNRWTFSSTVASMTNLHYAVWELWGDALMAVRAQSEQWSKYRRLTYERLLLGNQMWVLLTFLHACNLAYVAMHAEHDFFQSKQWNLLLNLSSTQATTWWLMETAIAWTCTEYAIMSCQYLWTNVGWVWPMRCTRPTAWASTAGSSSGSASTTCCASATIYVLLAKCSHNASVLTQWI